MRYIIVISLLLFTLSAFNSFSQDRTKTSGERSRTIDSLETLLKTFQVDTTRINILNALASQFISFEPEQSLEFAQQALKLAQDIQWKKGIGNSCYSVGSYYYTQGDYPNTLEYWREALKVREELNDKKGIATSLGTIAIVYYSQGDPRALDYYFRALKMAEEVGDKNLIAIWLGNLGLVYWRQGDYPKALEYFFKSLKIGEELGDKSGIATDLGNIGACYRNQGDYAEALAYYLRALRMSEELGRKNTIAINLGNIGALYTETGEFEKAEKTLQKAITLSKDIGVKERLKYQYECLSILYDTIAKPAQAFEAYKLYIIYRDSIANEENTKAQTRTEMKYEYEKAELVKEQEEREAARIEAEILSRRDNLQYSIVLICLLVIGVLVAMLGKLALPMRMAEGLIFFSFLILFEFILVLADPYIESWSGGAPGIKLLFNAGIAALIFPLHSLFETKLKRRLVK